MRDPKGVVGNEIDYGALAERIKEKRTSQGLSLREAAEQCGEISYTTLNRLERGTASPDLVTLQKVLAWLDIPASSLFSGRQAVRVHLRAQKRLPPTVAEAVATVAPLIQERYAETAEANEDPPRPRLRVRSRLRENHAERFREAIGYELDIPLDPFILKISGVRVLQLNELDFLTTELRDQLLVEHQSRWSAMTLPLNEAESSWVIVLNSAHTRERQRATLMEEFCHVLLGHHMTTLSHVEGQTFRDYDKEQEMEAYGLGAAILVPHKPLVARVEQGATAAAIAKHFAVSSELIEYRIKITGAWYQYKLQQHVTLQDRDPRGEI